MNTSTFNSLDLSQEYCEKLEQLGITIPTGIQQQVIPLIKNNKNIIFQSETGTGKTFAYLLPLLEKINPNILQTQLIIIAPTHELASQIKTQIQLVSDIKTALLIGGAPIKRQTELLKEKPLIVIGGPARLMELIYLKKLKTNNIKHIVFDEVDRLFSPELRDSTNELISAMPKGIQLTACSATITKKIEKLICEIVEKIQDDSNKTELSVVLLPPEDILRKRITHIAIYSETRDKIETLRKLLAAENPKKTMIFCSRAEQVEQIASRLLNKKINCCVLHAKTDKIKRKQALDWFRSGKCSILITSDLAARGLDIPGITHIIQMDLPSNDDFFIHRAGRTGRAGKTGMNIVIGDGYEMRKYALLEKKLKIVVNPRVLYKGKMVLPDQETENNVTT